MLTHQIDALRLGSYELTIASSSGVRTATKSLKAIVHFPSEIIIYEVALNGEMIGGCSTLKDAVECYNAH